MIQQLDFFTKPTPMVEQITMIAAGNVLVLHHPSVKPVGAEAIERKAARLREIEDRKREAYHV